MNLYSENRILSIFMLTFMREEGRGKTSRWGHADCPDNPGFPEIPEIPETDKVDGLRYNILTFNENEDENENLFLNLNLVF